MTRERRRRAYGRGRRAEALAAWWLRLKGYRILARDFRVASGEIDLIARRGRVIALVEVKARPSLDEAREALLPHQRARIERAAQVFLQRHPGLAGLDLRFDVVLLAPKHRPHHVIDAWRIEEALPRPPPVPRV
jgi:putative endonuclease